MTQRHVQTGAIVSAVVLLLVTVVRLRAPAGETTSDRTVEAPAVSGGRRDPAEDSLVAAAADIVANDPFRLANEPASVPYAPSPASAADGMRASVRPALTVKAVMGGPPWQAIVDGLPGVGTAVVRAGSVVAGLTVRAVRRDTVIIAGADTSWTLVLRQ